MFAKLLSDQRAQTQQTQITQAQQIQALQGHSAAQAAVQGGRKKRSNKKVRQQKSKLKLKVIDQILILVNSGSLGLIGL